MHSLLLKGTLYYWKALFIIERHSLLHGVSEFVPHFPYFLIDFGETRYRRPLRIPFEQVPLLWTSVWWKPYYLREQINLFTQLLKFSSSLDELDYRGSQQTCIERLWVLWESSQWKLTFCDGRKWLSARTFLICCPIWVKFGTRFLDMILLREGCINHGCHVAVATNFQWCIICVSPQHGTYFMSRFWRVEFWGGS